MSLTTRTAGFSFRMLIRALIPLALFGAMVLYILNDWNIIGGSNQFDFRSNYFHAKAFAAGYSPYVTSNAELFNTTPYHDWHDYTYHPITLTFYTHLLRFSYGQAVIIFFVLAAVLISAAVLVMQRHLLPEAGKEPLLFAALLLFGFNLTFFVAVTTGNTALYEAAFVWLALSMLVERKVYLFAFFLGLAALFKGSPFVLSALILLLPGFLQRIKQFVAVCAAFVLVFVSPAFFSPGLLTEYLTKVSGVITSDRGHQNPSSYNFFYDLCLWSGINPSWSAWMYGAFVLLILGATIYLFWRRRKSLDLKAGLFLALLAYALVIPRFKDYAFIQLIPAAFFVSTKSSAMLLINLSGLLEKLFAFPLVLHEYQNLFLVLFNWGFCAWLVLQPATKKRLRNAGRSLALPAGLIALGATVLVAQRAYEGIAERYVARMRAPLISGVAPKTYGAGAFEVMTDIGFHGEPLSVRGNIYAHGIAAHAPARLVYELHGQFSKFKAGFGILDSAGNNGLVKFRIHGDNRLLFESQPVSGKDRPANAEVNVSGVNKLTLEADDLGERSFDHSAWLAPQLEK